MTTYSNSPPNKEKPRCTLAGSHQGVSNSLYPLYTIEGRKKQHVEVTEKKVLPFYQDAFQDYLNTRAKHNMHIDGVTIEEVKSKVAILNKTLRTNPKFRKTL